jgi:hypothetical protein
LLEYVSDWDSTEHAAEFFRDYQKILRAKWRRCDPTGVTRTSFSGSSDNGYFVTRLAGHTVTSIEGLGDPGDWERLKSGAQFQAAVRLPFRARAAALPKLH